jgi:drug/metabolite transporter (DMT)-like permease
MSGWFCLTFVVVISTAIWPLGRWALAGGGNYRAFGFWTSLAAALSSFLALLQRGAAQNCGTVWLASGIMGLAYSVGFILLIMRCIQIGPIGPTVTINNSAMICGVLYGVLWLNPHVPNAYIICGGVASFAAMFILGMDGRSRDAKPDPRNREWSRLVMLGGMLSGVSFMTQTYVGVRHPGLDPALFYCAAGFSASAVILLFPLLRTPMHLVRPRILLGGLALGLGNSMSIPSVLKSFETLGPEIVLPVTVISPMVCVLLLGRLAYRERLSRMTWVGCLVAIAALAAIAYGNLVESQTKHPGTIQRDADCARPFNRGDDNV